MQLPRDVNAAGFLLFVDVEQEREKSSDEADDHEGRLSNVPSSHLRVSSCRYIERTAARATDAHFSRKRVLEPTR